MEHASLTAQVVQMGSRSYDKEPLGLLRTITKILLLVQCSKESFREIDFTAVDMLRTLGDFRLEAIPVAGRSG